MGMDKIDTIKLFNQGKQKWNQWADGLRDDQKTFLKSNDSSHNYAKDWLLDWEHDAKSDFSEHTFEDDADFSGFIFPGGVTFAKSEFSKKADFTSAVFRQHVTFKNVKFFDAVDFSEATFDELANFNEFHVYKSSVWEETVFEKNVTFIYAVFRATTRLNNCLFAGQLSFSSAVFHRGVDFSRANLAGASFAKATLEDADFTNAQLGHVNFSSAGLENANLLGAQTDTLTQFSLASVKNCKINRFALDCLEEAGGLSKGALMKMDIRDDVVILRKSYSGFFRWAHLFAMIAFVFPYAWFLFSKWTEARFYDSPEASHISLVEAFLRYVFNGGVDWQTGFNFHWSFISFICTLLFNVLRGFLLLKTKDLEFHQEVTGFPADFSLSSTVKKWPFRWSTWNFWFMTAKYTVWLFYAAVALNAFHFLTMQIPATE
jgi:uncharacterized protein YjbI with pentapeptide repeats